MPKNLRSLAILLLALATLTAAAAWQNGSPDGPERLLPILQGGPRYWKGNLHTHSFWSDGDDFPEMIADWYKRKGYHFLALSDHNILSDGDKWIDAETTAGRTLAVKKYLARFGDSWVERRTQKDKAQVRLKPLDEFRSLFEEPGRFLLIPAEEITHRFARAPVHINAVNLRDLIVPADGADRAETIRVNLRSIAEQQKRTGRRLLAFVNHPNFGYGIRAEDMVLQEDLRFFEIMNGHPSVNNYGDAVHAGTETMWDILLALRLGKHRLGVVYGLGTDDAHNYHAYESKKSNPGRAWVMVKAPHLSAEAIVKAMDKGDFYSTTGVVLSDIRREGNKLTLVIRPEKGVTYKTEFLATMKDAPMDSQARTDEKGNPLDVTRLYSPDVGKVVARSDALEPAYQFTGEELYIRARITSSKLHPNPFKKGDTEVAWTQPLIP